MGNTVHQMKTTTREQELERELAELKAKLAAKNQLHLKVSEKGAVSIYGLQRMPVTLYAGQWERLIEYVPEIQKFMKANATKLARKE